MGYSEQWFFVMSEAIWRWFSRMTKSWVKIIAKLHHEWQKIGIHGKPYIILFLTNYLMSLNTQIHLIKIADRSFHHHHQGWSFCHSIVTLPQLTCGITRNISYWYIGIIFINCLCTYKLVQRWSSLVNYNHKDQFPAIRYLWLSV